jgi:hypothetical protein
MREGCSLLLPSNHLILALIERERAREREKESERESEREREREVGVRESFIFGGSISLLL